MTNADGCARMRAMSLRFCFALAALSVVACSNNETTDAAPAPVEDTGIETAVVEDTKPPSVFAKGPYGTSPRDVAGPFVAPTTNGDWSFEEKFTGEDHYVFVAYRSTDPYSKGLLKAPAFAKLLAASP